MKKMLLVALCGISSLAIAADFGGVKKYGTAGCGLGSMVLGDKEGMYQVLAATTNGTSGSQTFGISSGTSNCEQATKKSARSAAIFIEANKVALANDIARGNGEALNTLLSIYGVENKSVASLTLKKNYKTIFPSLNTAAESVDAKIQGLI